MIGTTLMGGCGNNLFQIAMCLAHSLKHDLEYCIPLSIVNPHYSNQKPLRFPNIKYSNIVLQLTKFNEQQFEYKEVPPIDDVCFCGYWQSYKFFDDYRDEIMKAFGFDDLVTIPNICAIHYRAGDFKNFPTIHPIVSTEYIIAAINQMISKGYKRFLVFSDDIPDIKEIIEGFNWYNDCIFEYSEGQSDLEDLKLMASCSSNIISNSTYGWWAAYSNPNPQKTVVYPRKWFGDALPHDTKDLCPKSWISL